MSTLVIVIQQSQFRKRFADSVYLKKTIWSRKAICCQQSCNVRYEFSTYLSKILLLQRFALTPPAYYRPSKSCPCSSSLQFNSTHQQFIMPRKALSVGPFKCCICKKGFTRRCTIQDPHFSSCVRRNGNPRDLPWDAHPSCWTKGSGGPSGTMAPGARRSLQKGAEVIQ